MLHVVHVVGPAESVGAITSTREQQLTDAVRAALHHAGVSPQNAQTHILPGPPSESIRLLADRIAADVIVLGSHREREGLSGSRPLGGTARAVAEGAFAPCLVAARPLRLPLKRVLVPIDLSDTARGALLVGLSWASALRAGTTEDHATALTVLFVDTGETIRNASTTSVQRELEILRQSAGDWAGVTVHAQNEQGSDAADRIVDYASRQKADLVVLGTRGHRPDEGTLLGSVSASVTARLQLPMLLVPPAVWRAHGADQQPRASGDVSAL